MLVDNAFDFVDDSRALLDQMLPKIGELPNLGIRRIGRKNATNTIGTLSAPEPMTVVPKEFAKSVGIAFICLVHGGVIRLDDNNFGAASRNCLFFHAIIFWFFGVTMLKSEIFSAYESKTTFKSFAS